MIISQISWLENDYSGINLLYSHLPDIALNWSNNYFTWYYMLPVTLAGYEILLAPAMVALSFFSEETYFTPKMIILLSGQFVGYFIVAFTFLAIKKWLSQ